MPFAIRPYHPSDLYALYRICLLTGDSGADASQLYHDPELLGHFYAAPYAVREPDLCFVLTHAGVPSGYVLGTRDTLAFADWCEREWFPVLRERYPDPPPEDRSHDALIARRFYSGRSIDPRVADDPAHLHIDLLPIGQGQGLGQQLMAVFLNRLRELGVPGVHLGVGASNQRAIKFYARVGFEQLQIGPGYILFGMRFD
jgi:ribosomal protein S18 acetylase RimI-like enzyme